MKNPEYESGFIGCLLLKPEAGIKIAQRFGLTAMHFVNADHQEVFKAAQQLNEAGKVLDVCTIATESGISVSTIQRLIDDCPTAAHAEFYARAIRDDFVKKQVSNEIGKADGLESLRFVLEKYLHETTAISEPLSACKNCTDWLLNEPDEAEKPIIQGLFDSGDRVAVVGQSKARKSFYALQLAACVASGHSFLGATPEPQKVLLVNGEIHARSYKKRVRKMITKLQIAPDELKNLQIANLSESSKPISFDGILSLAKTTGAKVVVVDPAYLLLGDEIDQSAAKKAILDMKRFAAEGITLISIYHSTKGRAGDRQTIDRISGSGVYARDVAALVSLVEHAHEQDHIVINAITRNYPPSEPRTACFNDGAFELTDIAPVEKTSATKPKRAIPLDQAIECFSSESITYTEAIERIKTKFSCGENRAKAVLKELKNSPNHNLFVMEVGRRTLYSTFPAKKDDSV